MTDKSDKKTRNRSEKARHKAKKTVLDADVCVWYGARNSDEASENEE